MKRFLLATLFLCLSAFTFADRYQINDVIYDIIGITTKYALERAVDIDKDRVFESYDELHEYVDNLRSLFNNLRNLSSSIINTTYDSTLDEEGICKVTLRISTVDSKHFLMVPYPKYNSNDGFNLKLKAKDTNFLGTMETLNFDFNLSTEYKENSDKEFDYKVGMNFDYDYPFKLAMLDSSWNNDFGFSWTLGKNRPEFSYNTGFSFELPFKNYKLRLDLTQGIERNFDYSEYDDELFFTEAAKFSIPLKIAEIPNFDKVTFTPYIDYTWNWDNDGINEENTDLSSPSLSAGYTVSTGRVNWNGNFRNGIDMNMNPFAGYNYQKEEYFYGLSGTLEMYKSCKWIGLNARFYGFYDYNKTEKIGSMLRGIRDDQKYSKKKWNAKFPGKPNPKALTTSAAIVGNVDIPIHIITTDWNGFNEFLFGSDSWMYSHLKWMRYFDFELQTSIFGDFALTHNEYTGKTFAIRDGWYAGGVEVIVFPAKWRNLQVRASAGVDAGRKIVKKVSGKLFDGSWRSEPSALEISIGIGLHY